MRSITEDRSAQMMIIGILFLFMTITVMIAMIPALKSILNIAKQSDNLNCAGFSYNGDDTNVLSYNSSLDTDTVACLAINLYLPYILLIVLIGGVTKLLYDKSGGQQQYAGY